MFITPRLIRGRVILARDWRGPSDRDVKLAVWYKFASVRTQLQVGTFKIEHRIYFDHYHPWQLGPVIPIRDDVAQQLAVD